MIVIFGMQMVSLGVLVSMFWWASGWMWLVTLAMYFLMACVGGTVTFHRLLSHRSFRPPRWFECFGSLVGALSWSGSPLAWAAVHREHHQFADTERDPHSPIHQSLWRVHFGSMFHKPNLKVVPDLARDRWQLFLHRHYLWVNLGFDVLLALFDPWAILYAHLAPSALTWNGGSSINSICHSRTKKNGEYFRNRSLLGLLVFGEGWHRNHHERPSLPKFQREWWQIDLGWWVIKLVNRRPSARSTMIASTRATTS